MAPPRPVYFLSWFETAPLADQLFECASALGTVGLSRGITASLTDAGKTVIVALMFIGRTGPLVFAMALFRQEGPRTTEACEEDVIL